jgi:hypothetical protein
MKPAKRRAVRPSERVLREWRRRVQAEYRSAAVTQQLTLWLIQLGVSSDLITAGLRIVTDELRHAKLSHEVCRAAARALGKVDEAAVAISRASLELPQSDDLETDLTRAALETFCVGETLAVRLFAPMRKSATVPTARRALDRILVDEVRHRDFGWSMLDALLESRPAATKRLVELELLGMLRRVRATYAPDSMKDENEIRPEERAWGLLPGARYRQIVELCIDRDLRSRIERRSIPWPTA